jgi:hypothetical protein
MLNYNLFIVKDKDVFYFDVEEYNNKSDIKIENGDIIKFTYENEKYIARVSNIGTEKNKFYILEILKK